MKSKTHPAAVSLHKEIKRLFAEKNLMQLNRLYLDLNGIMTFFDVELEILEEEIQESNNEITKFGKEHRKEIKGGGVK